MNQARIWWRQVGSSLRLSQAVVQKVYGETSFVLRLPRRLPWQDAFYDNMHDRLSSLCAERTVRFLDCDGTDPGRQVLEELCSEQVRTEYWPGQSCAAYLAGLSELTLNQLYVWVRGIQNAAQLERWRNFAAEYAAAPGDPDAPRPLFVLEYRTDHAGQAKEDAVGYGITAGDCQVFCLEAAALMPDLPTEYLAALAQSVGDGDPELCGALIRAGGAFLAEPVRAARQILRENRAESGAAFDPADDDTLRLRVWRAQITVLFAGVEERRLDYIRANEARLRAWMPTPDDRGALIRDPYDLEFGNLFYMTRRPDTAFTRQEAEMIDLCRDVRNLLAHNEPVPWDKVRAFLGLGAPAPVR